MLTVWKYTLAPQDEPQIVEMPDLAEILHVGCQGRSVNLWARVNSDPSALTVKRSFIIRGTGHPDAIGTHVGTAFMAGSVLVWHVFEVTPNPKEKTA